MRANLLIIILVFFGLAALTAVAILLCLGKMKTRIEEDRVVLLTIDDIPKAHWAKLAEKRIFFGHQSVGYNIIDGIKDIVAEHDYITLNIVETRNPTDFDGPILAHSRIGKNTDPASKIQDFKNIMDRGVGDKVDIAFLKLCYVDITANSDLRKIIENYSTALKDLASRYPKTQFLHMSVPTCSVPKGTKKTLKECIKPLLGKPRFVEHNMKRQSYNILLAEAFLKTGSIFDLAMVESTRRDGFRNYVRKGTEKVYTMCPEYTEDGGHLSENGRKRVAEQLLIVLARIANNA